jgi:hypothetical protein
MPHICGISWSPVKEVSKAPAVNTAIELSIVFLIRF